MGTLPRFLIRINSDLDLNLCYFVSLEQIVLSHMLKATWKIILAKFKFFVWIFMWYMVCLAKKALLNHEMEDCSLKKIYNNIEL